MMEKIKLLLLALGVAVGCQCFAHILTSDSMSCALSQSITALPDTTLDTIKVRQFVVVNSESDVPVRDILVYTDDGQETKTKWDGTFSLRETFSCVNFAHPQYEKRYMLREEMARDTIVLIPNLSALGEVVVYGRRHSWDARYNAKLSSVDAQLMQACPQGFDILALALWGLDELYFKKDRHRKEMKKQKQKMILDNY